jgi:transcriptional regulator with XRE-family HTH domain
MPKKRRTGLEKWGMALAVAREAAGMTVRELAEAINASPGTVSNYETGKRMPGTREIGLTEKALGTKGRLKEVFDEWVDDISPEWSEWRDIEEHSDRLLSYDHSMVPGLLQTEDYARAVLSHDRHSPLDLEQRVEHRMKRQEILVADDSPTAVFVFSECILHHRVGSREVMYEQINHLIEMVQRPYILVQVVPQEAGYHDGLSGAFMIARLNGREEVAFQDGIWTGHVLKDRDAVSALGDYWQYIQGKALTAEATIDMLKKEAEKWKD